MRHPQKMDLRQMGCRWATLSSLFRKGSCLWDGKCGPDWMGARCVVFWCVESKWEGLTRELEGRPRLVGSRPWWSPGGVSQP